MNIPAIFRALVLLGLFSAPFTVSAQQGEAPKLRSFLGWMPMQPVTAGGRILLDMHRFYFAKPGAGDVVVLPDEEAGKFAARFDTASFTLGVQVAKEASGLLEIPVRVVERGARGGRGLANLLLLERTLAIGTRLNLANGLFRGSPAHHAETISLARRLGARLAGRVCGWSVGLQTAEYEIR